jgi:hypothetical protein
MHTKSAVDDIIYLEKRCRSLGIMIMTWGGKIYAYPDDVCVKHPYVMMAIKAHRHGLIKWLQILAS